MSVRLSPELLWPLPAFNPTGDEAEGEIKKRVHPLGHPDHLEHTVGGQDLFPFKATSSIKGTTIDKEVKCHEEEVQCREEKMTRNRKTPSDILPLDF